MMNEEQKIGLLLEAIGLAGRLPVDKKNNMIQQCFNKLVNKVTVHNKPGHSGCLYFDQYANSLSKDILLRILKAMLYALSYKFE